MRILITGAMGMLGRDAREVFLQHGFEVSGVGRSASDGVEALDITDLAAVRATFQRLKPDFVLHAAAYTDVEGCERDPDMAYRGNMLGAWTVATGAEEIGATLAAISTDFVFSGEKTEPYTEFDATGPLSHYGASKLAGETAARQACRRLYVIRTSWLYGVHGKNFPFTMINQAKKSPELHVVGDQRGSPTHTVDLARKIVDILATPLYGTYHVTNSGAATWHEFAEAIVKKAGFSGTVVAPITSDDAAKRFNLMARRPRNSVLRHLSLEVQGKDDLRPWEAALDDFIERARELGKI